MLSMGFLAFCFSPLTQLSGLAGSAAMDNALIIALEPLMTVLLARVFLSERIPLVYAFLVPFAVLGVFLLSQGSSVEPLVQRKSAGFSHLAANLLLIVSLVGEGSYSVFGRKLTERYEAVPLFGSILSAGFGLLTLVLAGSLVASMLSHGVTGVSLAGTETSSFHFLPHFGVSLGTGSAGREEWVRAAFGVLWLGPLGTAFAYLYWMKAVKSAPVISMAVTLFLQPLLGVFWGVVLLGEKMGTSQGIGAALIGITLVGQVAYELKRSAPAQREAH